jgi:ferric-dicitrate binding protein FerR (iron transport regulator)
MMTCDEFKELAPAYALIALDEDERRACAHHLASGSAHRGCVEAVEHATLVASRLGVVLHPSIPAPRVWQNIAAQVRAAGQAVPASAEEVRRRGLYHLAGWLVAAALLGLYLYAFPIDTRRRQPAALTTASGDAERLRLESVQYQRAEATADQHHAR